MFMQGVYGFTVSGWFRLDLQCVSYSLSQWITADGPHGSPDHEDSPVVSTIFRRPPGFGGPWWSSAGGVYLFTDVLQVTGHPPI